MKLLITGGAGMVGSHAAEYYAKKGDEVIVLDNLLRSKLFNYDKESVEYNWNYLKKYKNINLIKGDVRNREDVKKVLADGVDAVIHAAGQPGVGYSVENPEEDFNINAYGTLNVLECVKEITPKAAVIFCSTNKVYGENVDKIELEEKEKRYDYKQIEGIPEDFGIDLAGHTPYGVSKYTADMYVQEYGHIYGMKTAAFRLSCTYGIRQFGFEDQGWVAWFIIAAILGKPITIYGNGKQVRDLLYAADLVEAFDRFIESDLKGPHVFNVGGGVENTASLLEFVNKIESFTGKKLDISYDDWRPSDQKVYVSDISKLKRVLDWQPKINVDEGIGKIVKWVKRNKDIF